MPLSLCAASASSERLPQPRPPTPLHDSDADVEGGHSEQAPVLAARALPFHGVPKRVPRAFSSSLESLRSSQRA